ncbi:hypothetical protein [Sulfurovum sp.]|uniref:hypothetical protein n=1 Tax=Sulfurovum sp. TaxID=1969726 RepID=UPI0025D8CD19|nr:hypothetical protein [Sulfurovum sp.]
MRQLRNLILSLFILIEGVSAFEIDPFPEGAPLLEIFSTNCLQMTQSQQMLKAYVMIGLKSNFQDPKKDLDKAIVDYDKRVYQVKAYFDDKLGSNTGGKKAFEEALALWKESKAMLLLPPTKENALKIKKNFLVMINKLLAGTKPLATPDLELISLTGKLCRKPLEVTIDYLMRIWGVKLENYDEDVQNIISNYHKNLKTLSANKLNNDESLKLLKKAKREFTFFEFMYNSKSRFIPSLLSKKADDNFIIIRQIKKVFKKQAK